MITRRIPFILFVSVLALLGACAQTPRLPSVESPSDQARISQARESYRQAIEANPEALGPFAAYCRALPEMTDRRISELRGQLEGTRDVVRIKPMIETLVATHKELEADNAWLTAHCRCKQEDFNQALVGFREHARENEALIVSSEALARKHLSEQTKLSNGFAERARQFLLAKRIEDAQENAGHALEFNSENALARGVRDLVERFEKGRSLILTGHLQSGEPMLQEVQKSGFLAAESQTYLNDARGKRQRLAQIIVQADTMLRGKRLPEAVALLKSAIGIDKDQDAAITGAGRGGREAAGCDERPREKRLRDGDPSFGRSPSALGGQCGSGGPGRANQQGSGPGPGRGGARTSPERFGGGRVPRFGSRLGAGLQSRRDR